MKIRSLLVCCLATVLAIAVFGGCATIGENRKVSVEAQGSFLVILEPNQEKAVALTCSDASESGIANIAKDLRSKLEIALTEKGFVISPSAKIKVDVSITGFGGEKETMTAKGAGLGAAVGLTPGILASKNNRGKGALIGALIGAVAGAATEYATRETVVVMKVGVRVVDVDGATATTHMITKVGEINLEPTAAVGDLSDEIAKRVAQMFRVKVGG